MNKVFTNNLPHKHRVSANKDKLVIDWTNSIGYKIKFIYDDIQGELEIIDCYKKNNQSYLKIIYQKNEYDLASSMIKHCNLGNILGLINHNYKYQVGDIVKTKTGKIQILKQIKIKLRDHKIKGYKYKCLIDNYIGKITENNLNNNKGCPICCSNPQKVLIGVNDMWTTNPELAKLLVNPEDGYKYTECSSKKTNWRCPNCSNVIKNKMINNINKYGLSCPKCSDGVSIPEKTMFNILQQLDIEFIYQYSPEWIKPKRYDFYFELNNKKYIVETDGNLGHGNMDNNMNGITKEESKSIDNIKDNLAKEHNIEVIRIDCKESELEYIKNNENGILNSKLNELFNLSKIDWNKVEEYTCNSLIKKVCDYWNKGIHSTKEIGKIMKMSRTTIIKYLNQGNKLNWCNYNSNIVVFNNNKNNGERQRRKVICLNNEKMFESIKDAQNYYNIKGHNMASCCQGKRKYYGKNPITNESLRWMYYEDYLKLHKKIS